MLLLLLLHSLSGQTHSPCLRTWRSAAVFDFFASSVQLRDNPVRPFQQFASCRQQSSKRGERKKERPAAAAAACAAGRRPPAAVGRRSSRSRRSSSRSSRSEETRRPPAAAAVLAFRGRGGASFGRHLAERQQRRGLLRLICGRHGDRRQLLLTVGLACFVRLYFKRTQLFRWGFFFLAGTISRRT